MIKAIGFVYHCRCTHKHVFFINVSVLTFYPEKLIIPRTIVWAMYFSFVERGEYFQNFFMLAYSINMIVSRKQIGRKCWEYKYNCIYLPICELFITRASIEPLENDIGLPIRAQRLNNLVVNSFSYFLCVTFLRNHVVHPCKTSFVPSHSYLICMFYLVC